MQRSPYELVFGQPPYQHLFPGIEKTEIMEEDIEDLLVDEGQNNEILCDAVGVAEKSRTIKLGVVGNSGASTVRAPGNSSIDKVGAAENSGESTMEAAKTSSTDEVEVAENSGASTVGEPGNSSIDKLGVVENSGESTMEAAKNSSTDEVEVAENTGASTVEAVENSGGSAVGVAGTISSACTVTIKKKFSGEGQKLELTHGMSGPSYQHLDQLGTSEKHLSMRVEADKLYCQNAEKMRLKYCRKRVMTFSVGHRCQPSWNVKDSPEFLTLSWSPGKLIVTLLFCPGNQTDCSS